MASAILILRHNRTARTSLSTFMIWVTLLLFALFSVYWAAGIYYLWAAAEVSYLELPPTGLPTEADLQRVRDIGVVLSGLTFYGQECIWPLIVRQYSYDCAAVRADRRRR